MLGTASIASLSDLFAKLAIAPLNFFKLLFGCLSCTYISSSEGHRIEALRAIRWKSLVWLKNANREPNFLLLADVPVPHVVEVGKAHVIGVDVHHLLLAYFDLTADVVLSL